MPTIRDLTPENLRFRYLREGSVDPNGSCVLYWMQRSQRGTDNAALDLAVGIANKLRRPVLTVFALTADYPGAERRHFHFLVEGLPEIEQELQAKGIPLIVRLGKPSQVVASLASETKAALVIGDENPVRVGQKWRQDLARTLRAPFVCVDSDVVVPTCLFPREEYMARTIRPKILKELSRYMVPSTNPTAEHSFENGMVPAGEKLDIRTLLLKLKVAGVSEVDGYRGGPTEAKRRLDRFIKERLPRYGEQRNEPVPYMTSELSAHLHFGHVSPITLAIAAKSANGPEESNDRYIEELIVRRELAINYVARNPNYDRLAGCPSWALQSLAKHTPDPRPYLYDESHLERAETHDPIWNAAQKEMMLSGRMHGYLRMYWAKKILEWSPDAETAFNIALRLNDRYELDGRDPNGYTGVAWAIGGKHDRPWPERPIYGTVRTMTSSGLQRKFDTASYLLYVRALERGLI